MTALMTRPRPAGTPAVFSGCLICFGTGKVFVKPGVLAPCPNGCIGYTATTSARPATPRSTAGCAVCGCPCATGPGCGCSCCCSYLPAVTGGAR